MEATNIAPYRALALLYLQSDRRQEAITIGKSASEKSASPQAARTLNEDIARVINGPLARPIFQIDSAHYRLQGDVAAIYGHAVAAWLEQLYQRYLALGGQPVKSKLPVVLFAQRDSLNQYLRLEIDPLAHDWIARWWPVTGELLVAMDQHPMLLRKELLAAAMQQLLGNYQQMPTWLHQGLSCYFSLGEVRAQTVSWGKPPSYLVDEIRQLAKVVALPPLTAKEFYLLLPYNRLTSYAWVHFFIHSEQGGYRQLLKKAMALSLTEANPNVVNDSIFPQERRSEIKQAYKQYWSKIK